MASLPPALAVAMAAAIALSGCDRAPFDRIATLVDPADATRRAAVELAVKDRYPQVLSDIAAGGGEALGAAFDAAGIPAGDRPARVLQLQGDLDLYNSSPGALVNALVLYGA